MKDVQLALRVWHNPHDSEESKGLYRTESQLLTMLEASP
jgi:hypothetical protein